MMKKIELLLIALFATVVVSAQVPSAFNFQAVLRDAKGDVLKNANVSLSFSLLEDNATTVFYKEYIETKSDSTGVICLSISKDDLRTSINDVIVHTTGNLWMELTANYFFSEDENGDGEMETYSGQVLFPSQQLLSVPYSMMSGNVMLTSPNGGKYSLKVDDNGILSASLVNGVDSTSNRVPSWRYRNMDYFGISSGIDQYQAVIRTQEEYEQIFKKVPRSKIDFSKYTLVWYISQVALKDFYLEKISDTTYKFKKIGNPGIPVTDNILCGLLIDKIDESVTVDFSVDSPW